MRHILAFALLCATAACFDRGDEVEDEGDIYPPDFQPFDTANCIEGPTAPSSAGPQVRFVTLDVDRRFLQVRAGQTVTWTNADSQVHTVTAGEPNAELPPTAGGFDSGELAAGARWAYRFCNPRQTVYFCRTHPAQMNGYLIVVTP